MASTINTARFTHGVHKPQLWLGKVVEPAVFFEARWFILHKSTVDIIKSGQCVHLKE